MKNISKVVTLENRIVIIDDVKITADDIKACKDEFYIFVSTKTGMELCAVIPIEGNDKSFSIRTVDKPNSTRSIDYSKVKDSDYTIVLAYRNNAHDAEELNLPKLPFPKIRAVDDLEEMFPKYFEIVYRVQQIDNTKKLVPVLFNDVIQGVFSDEPGGEILNAEVRFVDVPSNTLPPRETPKESPEDIWKGLGVPINKSEMQTDELFKLFARAFGLPI